MKRSPLLLAVLTLCGCSLTGDDDAWPPTVEQVQAELGTPPRGTMRVKDYDQVETFDVSAVYVVRRDNAGCDIVLRWKHENNTEFKYNASFTTDLYKSCVQNEMLIRLPHVSVSLYPLAKYYAGLFRALDDSTITGTFVLKAQANGFIPATRRLAGTFTARRVACLPNSLTGLEETCAH